MSPNKMIDPNRGVRRVLYALGGSVVLLGLILSVIEDWSVLYVAIYAALGLIIMVISSMSFPYVELTPDGVLVRFLIRKRHYFWSEIIRAGRFWRSRKSPAQENFSLMLWCPIGKGRAIRLPNERQIRLFIAEYYGPLDFDDYKGISSWEKKLYELDKT